jgi:hypothetical protein
MAAPRLEDCPRAEGGVDSTMDGGAEANGREGNAALAGVVQSAPVDMVAPLQLACGDQRAVADERDARPVLFDGNIRVEPGASSPLRRRASELSATAGCRRCERECLRRRSPERHQLRSANR